MPVASRRPSSLHTAWRLPMRPSLAWSLSPCNSSHSGTSSEWNSQLTSIDGAMIEEWKYEAFVDKDKQGRDLFVTFLYFCNDHLVDTSDTRIDFRNNAQLVERWRKSAK